MLIRGAYRREGRVRRVYIHNERAENAHVTRWKQTWPTATVDEGRNAVGPARAAPSFSGQ